MIFYSDCHLSFCTINLMPGSHCLSPPTPPGDAQLSLNAWDASSPPAHGQAIIYNCSAGGYNRLETDFSKNFLSLECLPDNKFEETSWPKCVQCKPHGLI